MRDAYLRYLRAIRLMRLRNRVLFLFNSNTPFFMQVADFVPTFDQFLRNEYHGTIEEHQRTRFYVEMAVADAMLDYEIGRARAAARRELTLTETLHIFLDKPDLVSNLRSFLFQGLLREAGPPRTWFPVPGGPLDRLLRGSQQYELNLSHPHFQQERARMRFPAYAMAYESASDQLSRQLRRELIHQDSQTALDRAGEVAYSVMEFELINRALLRIASGSPLARMPAEVAADWPARNIPVHTSSLPAATGVGGRFLWGDPSPGAVVSGFQERGVFRVTEGPEYAVRLGADGAFYIQLFRDAAAARSFATEVAARGQAAIREEFGLVRRYEGGGLGNPVSELYIYEIPAGTPVIEGVAARMQDRATGRVRMGGGIQAATGLDPGTRLQPVGQPIAVSPLDEPL